MSYCRTLSSKGNVVDYRPAVHHNLFKLDGTFDFRFSALKHCQSAVDKYLKQVLWGGHKGMLTKLVESISTDRNLEKIGVSFVSTGLSDGDRAVVVDMITAKLKDSVSGIVTRIDCQRGEPATTLLSNMVEELNNGAIDPVTMYRSRIPPQFNMVSKEISTGSPLKALAIHLASKSSAAGNKNANADEDTLVIVLQHGEKLDVHVLDNLIILLATSGLPCKIHLVAFTDMLCSLPVQLSPAAQARMATSLATTVSPWVLYETLCSAIFSGRSFPLAFSPTLVNAIRVPFEESELCITSAVNRFKLCLAQHFQQRLSLLTMYRETSWLQQMNILSKSEWQFRVSDSQRRREAVPALRRSSTNESLSLAQSRSDSRTATGTATSSHPAREDDEETLASEDLNTVATDNWSEFGNPTSAGSAVPAVVPSGASSRHHADPPTRIGMDFAGESKDPGWKTAVEVIKRKMQHSLGVSALLTLLDPADLIGTGLAPQEEGAVVRALEAHDLRSRLDGIWFGCLKILRDEIIPAEDRPSFGSDLIWADIHNAHVEKTKHGTLPMDTTRVCNQLIYAAREHAPHVPAYIVLSAVTQLHSFVVARTAEVPAEECPEYFNFVKALLDELISAEEIFGFFAEQIENSRLSLRHNLPKMKLISEKKVGSGEDLATVQVNLRDRTVVSTDDVNSSKATATADAAGTGPVVEDEIPPPPDAAAALFALDMVTVYKETLDDFIKCISNSALRHQALSSPVQIFSTQESALLADAAASRSSKNSRTGARLDMAGILHFDADAESRAIASLNDNLHSTLVSSWKEDSPWLTAPVAPTKGKEHDRGHGRSSKQKVPEQPPGFRSDGAILFKLFKSCQQRDTADAWFQHFAAAVQCSIAWDLDAAAAMIGKRKYGGRRVQLDDRTVLKARFASALQELEQCGLIKCSAANTPAALALVPGLSTVVVERKIYTWV